MSTTLYRQIGNRCQEQWLPEVDWIHQKTIIISTMQDISVQELKRRMDAGEQLRIVDVREPDEYAEFNIGATLIPLGQIMGFQLGDLEDWKDEEVILHCRSGKRSLQAGLMLETMGFANVKNLTGGMLAWREAFNV
jgi:rhodanese-related sulfurtransferase